SSKYYTYFYKFDVTNFYDSIDINLLFRKINKQNNVVIDLRSSLIYKRLMQAIGNNKYPTVENSTTLSFLATYIYLDSVDRNLESQLEKSDAIKEFQIIRYVDDLYIFFNTAEEKIDVVGSKIKNMVIHEYQQVKLTLNEKKSLQGESKDVCDNLNAALYDHYVNENDINISSLFDAGNIKAFLDDFINISNSHSHQKYIEKIDKHFTKEDITLDLSQYF